MQRIFASLLALFCGLFIPATSALADGLKVAATSVAISAGAKATVQVTEGSGTIKVQSGDASVATAAYGDNKVTITGVKAGQTKVKVSDRRSSVSIAVNVNGTSTPPSPPPPCKHAAVARPCVE